MADNNKRQGSTMKTTTKRRRDNEALKNVISLRISDDELLHLARIRKTTSKSVSEIMREAFNSMQGQNWSCLQS